VGLVLVAGDGISFGIFHGAWHAGDFMCRLYRYLHFVIMIVSNNLLIGMSVDRFIAIKFPMLTITGGEYGAAIKLLL